MNTSRPIWLVALVLLAAPRAGHAENWDRFRGPNGAGHGDAAEIPSAWTPENFLWKQPLPGVAHSSPVVWQGRLYLTSADPDTGEQIIQAFDAASGQPLWQRRAAVASYGIHGFNSFASSTPAVDARHLYVMWLDNQRVILTARTHDGEEVWRRDIGPFQEQHGFGKSPIVVDDLVWVANDSEAEGAVVALDASTGAVRWNIPRPPTDTPFATPCLLDPAADNKQLLTVSTTGGLAAIDVATGRVLWQGFTDDLPHRCVGSPVVANGLVLVHSGQGGNGKYLVAVRPGDAQHAPQKVYRIEQNVPQVPTTVVAGDLLFLWHDRGVVSCHDVATGKQHWRNRVGGDFHSSPIRLGDRVLAAARDGEVVVLAAKPQFELLARNALDEPCHATPAVADGRLYIRGESTLFCIGAPPVAAK